MIRTAKGSLVSRLCAVVMALLAGVGLAACGGGGDDGVAQRDTSSTTAGGSANETNDDGGAVGGVKVEMLDPGTEPRTPLRFEFTEGAPFRAEMVMKMGVDIELDGEVLPSTPLPATSMVMAGKIDRVDGDTAEYSFRYEDVAVVPEAGVDAEVMKEMERTISTLDGVVGRATVTARGATSEAEIDTSNVSDATLKSTLDSLTSQMSSLTVPFPAEAVGIGARWRGTSAITLNGVETRTSTIYKLVEREGNRYRVELEQDLSAPLGDVDIPGMPSGTTAEIVSYDVANKGFVAGSLDAVMPGSSEIRGGGDIQMRIHQGQQTTDMKQRLTLELRLATV